MAALNGLKSSQTGGLTLEGVDTNQAVGGWWSKRYGRRAKHVEGALEEEKSRQAYGFGFEGIVEQACMGLWLSKRWRTARHVALAMKE